MKKIISAVLALVLLFAANPAVAEDIAASPGPQDFTWSELAAMNLEQTTTFTSSAAPTSKSVRLAGESCTLDSGYLHIRRLGTVYDYGSIGIKPKTTCSIPMASISHSTKIYKSVWWGWQHVQTPPLSTNYGVRSLHTTTIEVVCADNRNTTFNAIVTSTGLFPSGSTGKGSASHEATFACGTNP